MYQTSNTVIHRRDRCCCMDRHATLAMTKDMLSYADLIGISIKNI